jgi:hypothetical protein
MTCTTIQTGDSHLITFPEPNCDGQPTHWHASYNVQSVQQPVQSFVVALDSDLTFVDASRNLELPFDMRIWGDRVQNTHEAVDLWRGDKEAHHAMSRATHLRLKNQRSVDDLRFAQSCQSKGSQACKEFLHYFCQTAVGATASDVCGRKHTSANWRTSISTTQFFVVVIVALFLIVAIQTFRLKQKSHGQKRNGAFVFA